MPQQKSCPIVLKIKMQFKTVKLAKNDKEWEKHSERESYLTVAQDWNQDTEVEHVCTLQNKSQLRRKTQLQKSWCLYL